MKNYNMILIEKNGKIYKYEYLTSEKIILPYQRRVIEHEKAIYSPLGKVFGKQTKTIGEQGKKTNRYYYISNQRLETLTNKDDHKNIY